MEMVGATYYHRRVVPDDLRSYFKTNTGKPRTEFKTSLRTKDRDTANQRLELEDVRITALFNEARRLLSAGVTPKAADQRASARDDWERAQQEAMEASSAEMSRLELEEAAEDQGIVAWLGRPPGELSREEMALKRNMDAALFDPPEVKAARQRQREREWKQGEAEFAEAFAQGKLGQSKAPDYPKLLDLFDRYVAANSSAPATAKRWKPVVEHLVQFLGHDDASRVTRRDLIEWRNRLLGEETRTGLRSTKTVRDTYITAIKAVLEVAVEDGHIETNPASAVKVRMAKATRIREDLGFTDVEAEIILKGTSGPFSEKLAPESQLARRWVPWVCAYTGARVNEITQLRERDVFQFDNIWVLRITPEAGTVKNRKARTIPLHPHLIEQGFHKLGVKSSNKPLFYDPSRAKGGTAANPHYKKVGERLAKWVRELGVSDPEVAPNHGWRHLFRTRGYEAQIPEGALEWILGHTPSSEAKKYGFRYPRVLLREIEKLANFPG
jgi:integrase